MPHHDPARSMSADELATFTARVNARVGAITFCKDDAASIRAALQAVRVAIEGETWPHRENRAAVAAAYQIWGEAADTLLNYSDRAGMSAKEADAYRAWLYTRKSPHP